MSYDNGYRNSDYEASQITMLRPASGARGLNQPAPISSTIFITNRLPVSIASVACSGDTLEPEPVS
jgi:hypothetical protein